MIICNLIINNARLEQLDIASTKGLIDYFKTSSQSLIEKKLIKNATSNNSEAILVADAKNYLECNLTKREYEHIFAYVILSDLLEMAKYFATLLDQFSMFRPIDVQTYAKPIILFESHTDPSVLDFFRHLNHDFATSGYKVLYEKNSESDLSELISWLENQERDETKCTIKTKIALERLRFFAAQRTDLIFYDPRLAEHQEWKSINERYFWLFKAADWDRYYEPISHLVDQCMALSAKKHIISNQGKIILIAGSGHYKQLMLHLAPYQPDAFMIRTCTRSPAKHEQLAIDSNEVKPLVISVDAKIREQELNKFKAQYLVTKQDPQNYTNKCKYYLQ